jgi:hypothetical protein
MSGATVRSPSTAMFTPIACGCWVNANLPSLQSQHGKYDGQQRYLVIAILL